MTESEFWALLGKLNWKKTGDDGAVIEPVVKALMKRTESDIRDFEEILASKLFDLDTEAHARNIGSDSYAGPDTYFSVDLFLYARCCVVANGEDIYNEALTDPTAMPKDMDFEALLYIASDAFKRKTGKELGHVTRVSYETYSNKVGWAVA